MVGPGVDEHQGPDVDAIQGGTLRVQQLVGSQVLILLMSWRRRRIRTATSGDPLKILGTTELKEPTLEERATAKTKEIIPEVEKADPGNKELGKQPEEEERPDMEEEIKAFYAMCMKKKIKFD